MATAEEQAKLVIDEQSTTDTLLQLQADAAASRRETNALLRQSSELRAPSQADRRRQQEQFTADQDLTSRAVTQLNAQIESYGLDDEEKRLTRIDGAFDGALNRYIENIRRSAGGNSDRAQDQRALADRMQQLLAADRAAYEEVARNEGTALGDFNRFTPEELDALNEPDGVKGFVGNIAGSALGGLIGIGAVGASALGAEGLGQALGRGAQNTQDFFNRPDLGSVAAEQQFGDIIARTQLPEGDPNRLSLANAIVEGVSQGLGDGDFVSDLIANTTGALLGGGGIGAGVRGGVRLAGGASQGVARAGQALERTGAASIATGLGAGVDETLTTPEARGLVTTGAVSSAIAPALGRLGAGTIDSTVARATQGTTATARQNVLGRTVGTGVGEAGQEFVEGTGEALSQGAGQLGSVGAVFADTPEAQQVRSQALATGTVSAPLGAALGAPAGAGGAFVNNTQLAQQEQAAAEAAQQQQAEQARVEAENNQLANEIADARVQARQAQQVDQLSNLTPIVDPQEQLDLEAAEAEAALDAENLSRVRQSLNAELSESLGDQVPVFEATDPDARLDQVGQPRPQVATVSNSFANDPTAFINQIQRFQQNPVEFQALLRNSVPDQFESDPSYLEIEQSLLGQLGEVTTVGQAQQLAQNAQTVLSFEPAPPPDPATEPEVSDVDTTSETESTVTGIDSNSDANLRSLTREGVSNDPGLSSADVASLRNNSVFGAASDVVTEQLALPEGERDTAALDQAVTTLRGQINEKKPVALAEGGEPQSTRTNRLAAPRQPGSVRPVQLPRSQRLLPSESTGQGEQTFTPEATQLAFRQLTAKLPAKARASIKLIQDDDPILAEKGLDPTQIGGFTDGKTAYIVANSINSNQQMQDVIGEELFHRGFMVANGGNYNTVLDNIYKKRGGAEGLLGLARRFNAGSSFEQAYADTIANAQRGDKKAQRELADEVMARIAISPDLPSGLVTDIKRILTKIRKYAERLLGRDTTDTMTDQELFGLVRDANAAGRTGEPADLNIVRTNRIEGGEYATRDANGNTVYASIDGSVRDSTTAREDIYTKTASAIRAASNLSVDKIRNGDLGGKFVNSRYSEVVRRIANASNKLALMSRELYKAERGTSLSIIEDLAQRDEVLNIPELNQIIQAARNDEAARNIVDIETTHSTYASKAMEQLERESLSSGKSMMAMIRDSQDALQNFSDLSGLDGKEARQTLTRYMQALHTSERNDISFLKSAELLGSQPKVRRAELVKQMEKGQLTSEQFAELQQLVTANAGESRSEWNRGTGMTDAQADQVISNTQASYGDAGLDAAVQSMRAIIDGTNEVRDSQGAFSANQKATIALYNWQNYVPMRGNAVDPDEEFAAGPRFSEDVFAQTFRAFEGRDDITDDTLAIIYKNAISTYENRAAQDFIASVAAHTAGNNLSELYRDTFKRDGNGADLLSGSIERVEINSDKFAREMATKSPRTLVWYDPANAGKAKGDQHALLIKLNDSEAADAVFAKRSEGADTVDKYLRMTSKVNPFGDAGLHELTRFTASLKTSRNPVFIPFDAVRNILTFGYVTANEEGFGAWKDFMGQYLQPRRNFPVWNYVRLRNNGDFAGAQDLVAKAGPESELAALDEFFALGGPSNPVQAIQGRDVGTVRGQALGEAGNTPLQRVDTLLQTMNQSADLLARFAMYRSLIKSGETKQRAASRAKNVANFERRGTWSGPGSALFEFFNATAIGGTALLESSLTGRYGAQTMGAAAGAGFGMYMLMNALAGKDDNDEDRMAKINGKLFTNNLVFQYGDDKEDRLQLGFGFGSVASAISSGIQLARFALGHQNAGDSIDNALASFTSQANVLPLSGISPTESPTGFVFDTATPSILKPLFQLLTNKNSLGIPVTSEWAGDWLGEGASFEGRLGGEAELFESTAQNLRQAGIDVNPDALRHLSRSYLGGLSGLAESVFEQYKFARGESEGEVRLKDAFYLPRQFFGSTYSQLDQDFYSQFQRVGRLRDRVTSADGRGLTDEANRIAQEPVYSDNVELYESADRSLRQINLAFNSAIRDENITLGTVRELRKQRDAERSAVMRQFLEQFRE